MGNVFKYIQKSLALKLNFGLLLLAVPIFVLSLGIVFLQSRQHIKEEAMERAVSMLNTTAIRINRYMITVETATEANAWLVKQHLQPDSLLEYSRRIVMLNANVSGCSITPEPYTFPQYGKYFSAYTVRQGDSIVTVREGEYEYYDKIWYKKPKQLGKPCWVDPFDDFNEGTLSASEIIASYCKPLYADNGEFLGVITSDLSLQRLSEIVNAEKPYPNAYFAMLGEDGHYFIHPDTTKLINQTIFSEADAHLHPEIISLGHEMTTGKQGTLRVFINDAPCLVCYQPVPNTQWSLALVCPDSDILKNYNRLTYILVPLIVIGLLIILILCHQIITGAVKPLNRLLSLSQSIAAGQYDQEIPYTKKYDAVGLLQNSFAKMQESLNRHVNDIRQANTETKQRNEELKQASEMVEEAIRQKSNFIQNVSHQIRTPLNIIIGFSHVLSDAGKDMPPEELKDITDMIQHNEMILNRMALMLYDSSDTGLSEELKASNHEEVLCNEIARESIAETKVHFPGININFETSLSDSFCIHTNRLYLMRSLCELLYNSAKYSDGKYMSIRLSRDDNNVQFVFEDKGPGIPEAYHHQMYEFFTKVNDLSEGLGLGLPLAKRHMTNLGGDLTLDTGYHEGCRFIITLPVRS